MGCGGRTATSDAGTSDVPVIRPDAGRARPAAADSQTADAAAQPDELSALACDELFKEFHRKRVELTAQEPRACSAVADCEVVGYGDGCFGGCGYAAALSTAAVHASQPSVEALQARYCAASAAQTCVHVPLPCAPAAPPGAACVDGLCELTYR
jgi:hypothetical protein